MAEQPLYLASCLEATVSVKTGSVAGHQCPDCERRPVSRAWRPKLRPYPLLLLMMGLVTGLSVYSAFAEPFLPSDDNVVLERLPRQLFAGSEALELRRLRAELAVDPENLELALILAGRTLEIGRALADPRYQGYAQAALSPWWNMSQPPPGVLFLRAVTKQKNHEFDSALEDLDRLLQRQSRNTQAWLTRSVILTVKGEHAAALASCRPVRRSNPLLAAACLANAGSLSGRAEGSYELLSKMLANEVSARSEDRLWALTSLAEIAVRLGRSDSAEQHFREALRLEIRDVYLLAAFTDFLLDQQRPKEVVALLAGEQRADTLLLRLALAEARLGSSGVPAPLETGLQETHPPESRHVQSLKARFEEAHLRGKSVHLGAESRFQLTLLGNAPEALRLALNNWQAQREPIDARYVLEAALAAGAPKEASPVIAWLERSGLEDVRLADLKRRLEEAPQ